MLLHNYKLLNEEHSFLESKFNFIHKFHVGRVLFMLSINFFQTFLTYLLKMIIFQGPSSRRHAAV